MSFRKRLRSYIAHPVLQQPFRFLYRLGLAGMNYGGAGSAGSSGDAVPLQMIARRRHVDSAPPIVFDVGANIGQYVRQIFNIIGDNVVVYAFEPSKVAFEKLAAAFGSVANVHLVQAGVGRTGGSATLWSGSPGSVLASTYANPIAGAVTGETIEIISLDEFCEQRGIDRIALLKLDLEGGELDALAGAKRLLEAGAVELIQFEFGQSNLGARTLFVDLFQLLDPRYEIYRVLPGGLTRIAAYHETLEVFMSTNYLAVARP